MAQIIRGTTPTIEFRFNDIEVGEITKAVLTLKQSGTIIIEKQIADATTGESSISWTLSQADTLLLESNKPVTIVCDWLTNTSLRGRSNVLTADVGEPGKNEVI